MALFYLILFIGIVVLVAFGWDWANRNGLQDQAERAIRARGGKVLSVKPIQGRNSLGRYQRATLVTYLATDGATRRLRAADQGALREPLLSWED